MKHPRINPARDDPQNANPIQSALNGPIADVMGRGASIFGRGVSTFQREGMRFMTRRIEQNVKAVEQFGACKSLPDLLSAQQRWLSEMTRAYSEEWTKCSELVTEVLHENGMEEENGNGTKLPEPPRRANVREH